MITNKRILTIQDISCVGQCSITVAQPIISACGVETCILPAAVLSTHTGGFHNFTFRDLTEDMPRIAEHWKSEGIAFDAVYTGYLGSEEQIDIVKIIMDTVLLPDGIKIVDPAMADHGKLYYGFDNHFVGKMAELCGSADIILPNMTEAALMTGTEYRSGIVEESYIKELLEALSKLGAPKIILKGVSFEEGKLGVAIYDAAEGKISYYFTEEVSGRSHGTGDCFAAAFVGSLMQGLPVQEAAAMAADFVVECMLQTAGDPDHWYGVKFEKALPMLVKRLNQSGPKSEKAKLAAGERIRYILDAEDFDDKDGFFREMGRLLSPDGAPVSGLDALNDLLRGGFGKHAYGAPVELVWYGFRDSWEALGSEFMMRLITMLTNREEDHDVLLKTEL